MSLGLTATILWLVVAAQPPMRLQGRVTDLMGLPLRGVTISVVTASGLAVGSGSSDASGEYSIAVRDHYGPAQVKASLLGFVTSERTMVVYPGNNLWDVGLAVGHLADPNWRTISGIVVGPDGRPMAEATVTLHTVHGLNEKERLRSDSRGSFSVRVAEAVQYVIVVSKPGHVGHAAVVDMGDKQTTSLRITLGKPATKFADRESPR